jgi:hypothetical protein
MPKQEPKGKVKGPVKGQAVKGQGVKAPVRTVQTRTESFEPQYETKTVRFFRQKVGQFVHVNPLTGEQQVYKSGDKALIPSAIDLAEVHGHHKFELTSKKAVEVEVEVRGGKPKRRTAEPPLPKDAKYLSETQNDQTLEEPEALEFTDPSQYENTDEESDAEDEEGNVKGAAERASAATSDDNPEDEGEESEEDPEAEEEDELSDEEEDPEEDEEPAGLKSKSELSRMNTAQLKEYAELHEIELGKARTKTEIHDAIVKHQG